MPLSFMPMKRISQHRASSVCILFFNCLINIRVWVRIKAMLWLRLELGLKFGLGIEYQFLLLPDIISASAL